MQNHVSLAICGDVMLGRLVNETLPSRGNAYPWGNMLPLLQESSLFLINQEFALTAHEGRWRDGEKAFYFRADPEVVESLVLANVGFASLSNNHIADFEMIGLLDTITVLESAGIAHAGAGADDMAARAPAIIKCHGRTIGVVAFADYPPEWAAASDRPGLNYTQVSIRPSVFERVESAIQDARRTVDIVIFSIHWGPNMRVRPPGSFQAFARKVIDSGADIFWGHSAHVLQGIEIYRGAPILYDTGDFVDDYAVDPNLRNDLTALFQIKLGPEGIEGLTLVPAHIGLMQVNRAIGSDREWLVNRITDLCSEFDTDVLYAPAEGVIHVDISNAES